MAGTNAVDAADGSGDPDGAPGIGAEGEICRAPGDRGGGAAGGAAGDPPRRIDVDRGPVMEVLAVQAIGQLIGDGLADQIGTGRQQALDRGRGGGGWWMGGEPVWIAAAGHMAGNIEDV